MRNSSIRIAGDDGASFPCAGEDTILASALRAGLGFPYECNSGGCGACQITLIEGDLLDRWPEAPGISDRQRGRGRRLACQSVPDGDCTIEVRLDAQAAPPVLPKVRSATFASLRSITADMAEFTFHTVDAADFRPGQFAMFGLPGIGGARAYSMSNLANGEGEWRFIIKQVPGGKATSQLFGRIQPGEVVRLDGPYGNSYLRPDSNRDIVCIAGGSGISPVMSVLRGIAATPALDGRRVLLFHGGRGPADMCAAQLLAEEPALASRVTLHGAISDDQAPGAADWTGLRGMIHEQVATVLGDHLAGCDFYFCGPPPMTDAVHRLLLLEAKVPAAQLHFDRFY